MNFRAAAIAAVFAVFGGAGAAQAAGCGDTYVVRHGDWLSRIAQRCGVSMDELAALNPGLDADTIEAGQTVLLRAPEPVVPVFDAMRVPVAHMPPARPLNGPVSVTGEIVRDAGTCLVLADSAGRLYSFASGSSDLKAGMWVRVTGEVVDNWFCGDGAEVLVETVEPDAEPAQIATRSSGAL